MRLLIFIWLMLSSYHSIFSQVTIGSDSPPNSDALLDLKQNQDGTSNKGFLMPRISLVSKNSASPLANHVKGMFVYNIADIDADIYPGCYYNDGTEWLRLNIAQDPNSGGGSFPSVSNGLTIQNNNITWGGLLTNPTTITGISATNKLLFSGSGTNAINFLSNTLSIGTGKVGIGTDAPVATLDVRGNARITGNLGTPNRLIGRDNDGNISTVITGSGLSLTNGILSATSSGGGSSTLASNGLTIQNNNITWGGPLTNLTTITGISATNRLLFIGSGTNAINFLNNTLSIGTNRVGIGTNAPVSTLDVRGNARITGSTGTPTSIVGRNSAGDVSTISTGSGLSLSNGVLTATAGSSTTVYAYLLDYTIKQYNVVNQSTPIIPDKTDYTVWVSGNPTVAATENHLILPVTTLGRVINIVAAHQDLRVGVEGIGGGSGYVTIQNSVNETTYTIPKGKRVSFQYIGNAWDNKGTWIIMMKDF